MWACDWGLWGKEGLFFFWFIQCSATTLTILYPVFNCSVNSCCTYILLQVITTWWKCDRMACWQSDRHMVYTSVYSVNICSWMPPWYAVMVSPLDHLLSHSSWLALKRPRQQLVKSHNQPVHWHLQTCTNCINYALRHQDCHLVNVVGVWWDMWVFLHSMTFLNTNSYTWRQFISLHGSCCWGLRKLFIWSLKALFFIQESMSSLLYSVAWWIVTWLHVSTGCFFLNHFAHSKVSTDRYHPHLEALCKRHWSMHLSHSCTHVTGQTLWSKLY